MAGLRERLDAGIAALGLELAEGTRKGLLRYIELLARWNRAYNLTAVRDPVEMVPRHLLDALAVLPFLHGGRVVDVGSGAGLPGVPLALAAPERAFTLLDGSGKRTRFLVQAAASLGLDNVTVVHSRAEAYRPGTPFDTVVARAFAPLDRFLAQAGHLVAPDGVVLAMKGAYPEAELAAVPPAFRVVDVRRLEVPGLEADRHLVRLAAVN